MEDFKSNKPKFLHIGGADLMVGSKWSVDRKIKGTLLNLFIRKKASDLDLHYGTSDLVETKSGHASMYTLFDFDEDERSLKKTINGDLLVAKNINKWLPKDIKKSFEAASTIFVHSLEANDIHSEPHFWIVSVDSEGVIQSDITPIQDSTYSLKNAIQAHMYITPPNIVYLNTDGPTRSFFKEHEKALSLTVNPSKDFIKENINSMAFEIDEADFVDAIGEVKGQQIKRVYKPSQLKVKKLGVGVGVLSVLVSSWFGYSYVSQMESFSYFNNEAKQSELQAKMKEHADIGKELKGSSTKWDEESFREETLKQFIDGLNKNVYSPLDIALVIREINKTYPIFAAEWRLKEIVFEQNRFFIKYDRIKGGKGVYFLLDDLVKKISKNSPSMTLKPFDLEPEGDRRTYQIIPNIDLPKVKEIQKMEDVLREENKRKSSFARANKKANDSTRNLMNKFTEYNSLTFKEIWLERKANDLYAEVSGLESKINRADRLFDKTKAEMESMSPLKLERTLTLGNRLDFITMMQLDSFFDWSIPEVVGYYPNMKMLTDRNPKKKKGKAPSPSKVYYPAIESYTVKITSQNSEEEGKTTSYGVSDIIQLGILINKPFVNVDFVKYDKMTEQWELNLHFHRQTPEYRNRISKD